MKTKLYYRCFHSTRALIQGIALFQLMLLLSAGLFAQGPSVKILPDSTIRGQSTLCGLNADIATAMNQAYSDYVHSVGGRTTGTISYRPQSSFPVNLIQHCGAFNIYYEDDLVGQNDGFADPSKGTLRKNTLCAALTYIQSVINIPAGSTIDFYVLRSWTSNRPAPADSTGTLAYAAPFFPDTIATSNNPGVYPGNVYRHITSGIDPDPNNYDGYLKVNFDSHPYWDDYTNTSQLCVYDLYTVLLHEFTHSLGWLSFIVEDNTSNLSAKCNSVNNQYSLFDWKFMYYGDVAPSPSFQKLVTGSLSNPSINASVNLNSRPLRTNKIWLYNNANPLNQPVYAGSLDSSEYKLLKGAIMSHLNYEILAFTGMLQRSPGFRPAYVMGPTFNPEELRRTWTLQEIRALLSLGYTLNPTFATSTSLNSNDVNQVLLNTNIPPVRSNAGTVNVTEYNGFFSEFCATDDSLINNNTPTAPNTSSITITLASDPNIADANGDVIRVFPNSLFNIRGCSQFNNTTQSTNNHDRLSVNATGNQITYTPAPGYVGRAQFGFHLWDGHEMGAFKVYTIDVKPGSYTVAAGGNLVLNGTFEDNSEVIQRFFDEKAPNSSSRYFRDEGLFCTGHHFAGAHPYNYAGNHFNLGGGSYTENSWRSCFPDSSLKGNFGYPTNSWSVEQFGPGSTIANTAVPNNQHYEGFQDIVNISTLINPVQHCNTYTLEFDVNLFQLTIGQSYNFTLQFIDKPGVGINPYTDLTVLYSVPLSFTITTNGLQTWQHVSFNVNYCATQPSGYINLVSTANALIDNISLKQITPPPLSANISATVDSVYQGQPVTLTANVSDSLCNVSYLWTPGGAVTKSITVTPYSTTLYSVQVSDGCRSVNATKTIIVKSLCGIPATNTLGHFGTIDTLDANGGTMNFAGNYHVASSIVLKNGTFNISPGSNWYIDGYSGRQYDDPVTDANENTQSDFNGGVKGSYIYLLKATLNINGATLQASCDTMWGGIRNLWDNYNYYGTHYNDFSLLPTRYSVIGVQNAGGHRTTISDGYNPVSIGADTSFATVVPPFKYGIHGYLNGTKFQNCYRPVSVFSGYNFADHSTVDTVINVNIDCNPDVMKWPFNKTSATNKYYTYIGLDMAVYLRPTYVKTDTVSNAIYGVAETPVNDEAFVANIQNCQFNNNLIAAFDIAAPNSFSDSTIFIGNTVNLPTQVVNTVQIPPSFVGQAVGVLALTNGMNISNNTFNGVQGMAQQGVVYGEFEAKKNYNIASNHFNNLSTAISGLGLHSQKVEYYANTFTGSQNAITIDKNAQIGGGIPPSIFIHCNNFDKGSAPSPTIAINIPATGITGQVGHCMPGQTAGNKYINYNTPPFDWGISNLNATPLIYEKSFNEQAGTNFGRTRGITGAICGLNSKCTTVGQPLINVLPTLLQVTLAIEQLINNLIFTEQQYQQQLSTIVGYYQDNCGPQYQQAINQMLPTNLRAYNDLSWNLAECFMAQGNPAGAIQVMQQIVYNNPGNVQLLQRSNYYTAMLNISAQQTGGLRVQTAVSAANVDLLAQVAASGTEYSVMACYALLTIAPSRTAGCFSLPQQGGRMEGAASPALSVNGTEKVAFANAPNPFSESTTVAYQLASDVQSAVLKIYDIQGRLVRTQVLDLGANEIIVAAQGLKDGVYIYTIATDGTESLGKKRMVIIR